MFFNAKLAVYDYFLDELYYSPIHLTVCLVWPPILTVKHRSNFEYASKFFFVALPIN